MLILEMNKMDLKIVSLRSENNRAQTREEMVVLNHEFSYLIVFKNHLDGWQTC